MKVLAVIIILILATIGCQRKEDDGKLGLIEPKAVIEDEEIEPVILEKYRIFDNKLIADETYASDEYQSVNDIFDLYNEDDLLNVTVVYLSKNNLTSMAGIERVVNVESIDLSYNNLTVIEGLADLEHLRILELRLNAFEDISELLELRDMEYINIVGFNLEPSEYLDIGEQVAKNNPGAKHLLF